MTYNNNNDDTDDDDNNNRKEKLNTSRSDILSLLDDFIEQINQIRRTLFGVSISALILSPLAIILSIYLILHPSFFAILEIENEFGLVLTVLLSAVILISSIWLTTGIRQYLSLSSWNNRYKEYIEEKQKIDKMIESKYGLDDDNNDDNKNDNDNSSNKNDNNMQQQDFKNNSVN